MATTEEKQHVPVFVSSTYEDLKPYRTEVQNTLVGMEQIVKGMEYFGSDSREPLEVCLQTLRECKFYIGIIGMRYGSVKEDVGKSFTQLEYETAYENKIPILIYLLDLNYPIPPRLVDTGEKAQKLTEFKSLLEKRHTVSYFTTPEDLAKKISNDLPRELSKSHYEVLKRDVRGCRGDYELYRKFVGRPFKYSGEEAELDLQICGGSKGLVKSDLCSALGLQPGDTLFTTVCVKDGEEAPGQTDEISLLAQGKMADWMEGLERELLIRARVRLAFCILKSVSSYDEGATVKEVMYKRLILLEVLEEK